jgi:periplasmic protein TonB
MRVMSFQALLFCPDEKTARVVTQVLTELDFKVEACGEPFAAVKRLMAQHFDAIVVDCDNEQNATLLFKSARNSSLNQSALSVAVVEGQTGVAKAFRIGANLVLTKPINVEQSKGTIRVARGLLRKGESAKSAAAPPADLLGTHSAQKPQAATPLTAPVMSAASSSAFEVEAESAPALDAAEAALLEYMPDSTPSSQISKASTAKPFPWQPVSQSVAEPMATALDEEPELEPDPDFAISPESDGYENTIGAATAPARAREVSHPDTQTASLGRASSLPSSIRHDTKSKFDKVAKLPATEAIARNEAPVLSSIGRIDEREEPSAGGIKGKLGIAAVAVLALAAYFGWSKLHRTSTSTASQVQPAVQPPVQAPANPNSESQPPANENSAKQTEETVVAPDTTTSFSTVPEPQTASAKPSAAVPLPAPAAKIPTPVRPEPLVVHSNASQPKSTPATVEVAEAPEVIGAPSNSDKDAISGIVTSTQVQVPTQAAPALKVSQGVFQGLLIKKVAPNYPAQAKQLRLEGPVLLQATILKDGSVGNVKQLSGDAVLGHAAIDAVRQWKYKPYYLNGEPTEIQTQITVNFKLP